MRWKSTFIRLLTIFFLFNLTGVSVADSLYGITSFQNLYSIDIETGTASFIGNTGFNQNAIIGLSTDPLSGNLIGDASYSGLYKINTTNATPTYLTRLQDATRINGLAFNSTGLLYGVESHNDDLAIYDIITGSKTLIGYTGIPYFGGLDFNSNDILYCLKTHSGIVTLDTLNGTPTTIGILAGYTYDGIAFDENDTLYSTRRMRTDTGFTSELVIIDSQNANVTSLGLIEGLDSNIVAIAFGPTIQENDEDDDGVPDGQDICPGGDDNVDSDGDGTPDYCDTCPFDVNNDSDGDGVCDSDDICVGDDTTGDSDGDGLCDDSDPCIGVSNSDVDSDGVCDEGDLCLGDDASGNTDGDGVCNDLDQCEGNDAAGDTDSDGVCDDIDACPVDPANDADGDGICESDDNCPLVANDSQYDTDDDGEGDACDNDDDGDGIIDDNDNCQYDMNNDQSDFDNDGAGDVCDSDDDNDGVIDADDQCLVMSDEVVNEDGCSVSDLCQCDNLWKNHGAYVRCVAHTSEDFVEAGLLTFEEKDAVVSQAAESTCGHKIK